MPPTRPSPSRPRRALPFSASDLQGLADLSIDGVLGIVDLVEAMHLTIGQRPGPFGRPPPGRTRGITGFVYGAVRGTTRVVRGTLRPVLRAIARVAPAAPSTPQREALLAALNGVWGDHLAATANPLAIPMSLRQAGWPLDVEAADPKSRVLVLVHGLCMNDLQWHRRGHDHGAALARELGMSAVYLHYNSGRHVSENGRAFAALLEALVARWPMRVDELVIVGHSMGGLVARSACHYGREAGHRWIDALRSLAFLGTPHHGAPLERGGRHVDALFGVSPYLAPFSRLGKVRSAGITDLRYGNLVDEDWSGPGGDDRRHDQRHDDRRPIALPAGVQAYAIAACTSRRADGSAARVVGDGLVPVASALGEHADPALDLALPESHRRVFMGANHWGLLSRRDVYDQLRGWVGG
jgi:hypothetical protein